MTRCTDENLRPSSRGACQDINIDGDSQTDLTYRWTFNDNYRDQHTFLYNTGPYTRPDLRESGGV